ncbi:MAG: hypothetical protein KDC28_08015 [Saprospiraceae bacterium]|nr:hypothetical protein [Saprospiraceae bacterium]MCB9321176.1 hypothetical protein [Lewinellaceae bacterium]
MQKWFTFFLLLGVFISCHKDEVHVIDARVQPYLDRFLTEGEIRGVDIDVDAFGLDARVENILSSSSNGGRVLGYCDMAKSENHIVVFDAGYWSGATDLEKELLVFHELGHCLLGRQHDDSSNPDGTCLSIMHSGTGSCRNAYNLSTRSQYLDELFRN